MLVVLLGDLSDERQESRVDRGLGVDRDYHVHLEMMVSKQDGQHIRARTSSHCGKVVIVSIIWRTSLCGCGVAQPG
jgi:hypothetical protein